MWLYWTGFLLLCYFRAVVLNLFSAKYPLNGAKKRCLKKVMNNVVLSWSDLLNCRNWKLHCCIELRASAEKLVLMISRSWWQGGDSCDHLCSRLNLFLCFDQSLQRRRPHVLMWRQSFLSQVRVLQVRVCPASHSQSCECGCGFIWRPRSDESSPSREQCTSVCSSSVYVCSAPTL